jgi:hypothetical protein
VIGFIGHFDHNSLLRFTNHCHTKASIPSYRFHSSARYLLPTVKVPPLPGSRPRRLAAISHTSCSRATNSRLKILVMTAGLRF